MYLTAEGHMKGFVQCQEVLIELQTTVNVGMTFNWLIIVFNNVRHIHLLLVKTLHLQNN